MSDLNYRGFQGGDEAAVVELWNRCLPADPITPTRFRTLVLLDANFDPEGLRLAFDGGRLCGFLYCLRRLLPMHGTDLEDDKAWITCFAVDGQYRRRRIASVLLDQALGLLGRWGRKQAFFSSYAPNYVVPGIDEAAYPAGKSFLLSRGFAVQYSPVAMDRSLVGYAVPAEAEARRRALEDAGYVFGGVRDGDLPELVRFATDVFNPDWGRAIREGAAAGMPLCRILTARAEGRLIGFCMHGAYEGVRERFGPFGVDPACQGRGVGKVLLAMCLERMRAEGLHGAWFLWTGEKSPAGHVYLKAGFAVTRRFHVMRRDVG